jgi:hypothetical protein
MDSFAIVAAAAALVDAEDDCRRLCNAPMPSQSQFASGDAQETNKTQHISETHQFPGPARAVRGRCRKTLPDKALPSQALAQEHPRILGGSNNKSAGVMTAHPVGLLTNQRQ